MKKILYLLTLCLSIIGIFNLYNPSLTGASGVNNFEIQDFQIDYYLGKDDENRSTLKTVELIAIVFPGFDQNHGIERAIPDSYNGHTTSLNIVSVTNEQGINLNYTTYYSNGNVVIRIGDANRFVHGLQTYKITYTQRDVTNYFSDTNKDEFYWDTNGTEWAVPIGSLVIRIHLEDNLKSKLTNDQRCYVGRSGSTKQCTIEPTTSGYTAAIKNLSAKENMTVAVGFEPNSFAPYKMTVAEILFWLWISLLVVTFPIALIATVWIVVRYVKRSNRTAELRTIVPEYLPPRDVSVSTAASISRKVSATFSAQLIDFAVRHYIKIYQTREKSLFQSANYELEIIKDISNLKQEEQEVLKDIFVVTNVGARLDMSTLKQNTSAGLRLSDNQGKLNKNIAGQYQLRAKDELQSKWFKTMGFVLLACSVITLSPWLLVTATIGFILSHTLKPLTDKGLGLSRYLKGLEMYIKVAEEERLRYLQSPDGAIKANAPIDTNKKRQLIKLYEKVLPYAILFGQEKNWNKQLAQYYQSVDESPVWYSGMYGTFNPNDFSTAISTFNTTATYSSPSSSSSSGSGGGGSSGGGGGGGGGGGW